VLTKEDAEGRSLIPPKKRARFELRLEETSSRRPSRRSRSTCRVTEVVKGCLILDRGVRGFLPASLVDIASGMTLDEF